MNVLHVNNVDLPGRRFNGYDLIADLSTRGINGKQAVLWKTSDSADVFSLVDGLADETLVNDLHQVELRYGVDNLLNPWGKVLAQSQEFFDADVVHYHLVHNQVVSLLDLPHLFDLKPSVWTIHDPWMLTGHCIYPMGCDRWLHGCEICPFLDRPLKMDVDGAARMWRLKQQIFPQLDVDLVVASQFMLDMLRQSPLTTHFERVHMLPFGLREKPLASDSEQRRSRRELGIPAEDFVLFFRSTVSEFKGLVELIAALKLHAPGRSTTLLTVDCTGLLEDLAPHYNIVELGWVDNEPLSSCYSACDAFAMPSAAEAFGLMAIEAMNVGRPVICLEGTSLPEVTGAPECGIAVPQGDPAALRCAIDLLSANPEESKRRGGLGQEIVRREYGHDRYLDALAALYREIRARHASG